MKGATPEMIDGMTRSVMGARLRTLALVVALGWIAGACDPSAQPNEAKAADEFVKTVNVEVLPIAPSDFTAYIRLTGEVEALEDVTVSAEEGGVIERFYVEKGEFVRKGAPLAKIRDRVLRAQVKEAAAAAALARERYDRQRQLWEEDQIGSEIAYLEAKYQAELQAARLEVLQAKLDRTLIKAPISGVFEERYVDAGEMVAPGTRVARLVNVDRLKVVGGVAERFAASVHLGDTARVTFGVFPDRGFVGTIGYVGSVVDERNRTIGIEIVLDNPGRAIKPQMIANVLIPGDRLTDVVVIPQSAIMRTENGYEVYVVAERDGQLVAETRPVRLGPSYANRTVIADGLEEGDRLVVRGHQLLEAGDRVRIMSSSAAEPSEL
jgi:RND family efflux transporter MFP subunit